MAARDYSLAGTLPPPYVPLVDPKTGLMTEEWRRRAEAEHTALFGPQGDADVTADIPTGSYVGGIVGDPGRGLTVAGTPAPGYTVTFTLAQDIRTTASPQFVGLNVTGNIALAGTIDGRDVSVDGAKLDTVQSGATANSTDAALRARASHTGTQALSTIGDVTITAANLNSLDDGADTTLHFHASDRARANHTGSQLAATISDFNTAADARVAAGITGKADKQATALTDAVTTHAVTDLATTNAALDALGVRINAIHTVLRAAGVGT